jgi:hypothetical protein
MPRAFGFDADSAYYESLAAAVRKSEADKAAAAEATARTRRASMGLPEEEKRSKKDAKKIKKESRGKKSISEKVANFVFNGGRRHKVEDWQRDRIGRADGKVDKRPEANRA